jgi:hypothetical protein
MFRDLALSRDSMIEYHKRLGPEHAAEQRFTTMVLQQSFWPFSSRGAQDAVIPTSVCLPLCISLRDAAPPYLCQQMQAELDAFAAFYNEKHQGHKIEWNHALGTVNLRACFAMGQKELSVSLYQAVVLLLFNEMTEIPFADVKLHTGIGESLYYLPATKIDLTFLRSLRGRGVAVHTTEPRLWEEKGAQETTCRERCARRRRVRVQRRVRGPSCQSTHQLYPG